MLTFCQSLLTIPHYQEDGMNDAIKRMQSDEKILENLEEHDLLGFMDIAEKEIIPEIESFKPPLIYGIYGRWGSGKTFMMSALKKCFDKRERKGKYKTVWFDPWWYDHADKEQLFVGLLNKIQKTLQPRGSKIKKVGLNVAAAGLSAVRLATDIALSWASGKIGASGPNTKDAEEYFKQFQKLLLKNQLDAVDAVEKTRDALCCAINDALSPNEVLVLFIDDLDRCLPDRAILLLDQLKNFLNLSRVITILGIDDKAFSEMLQSHYKYFEKGSKENTTESSIPEPTRDTAQQYLEKIIRRHYRLGPGIIGKLLEGCEQLSELKNHYQTIERMLAFSANIPLSLRQIKRSLEKLAYIFNNCYSEKEATEVISRCGIDLTSRSVIYGMYQRIIEKKASEEGLPSIPQPLPSNMENLSRDHMTAVYEGILVHFWGVITLSNIYDFPLNPNTFSKGPMKTLQPPAHQLNKVYDYFREKGWL